MYCKHETVELKYEIYISRPEKCLRVIITFISCMFNNVNVTIHIGEYGMFAIPDWRWDYLKYPLADDLIANKNENQNSELMVDINFLFLPILIISV